MELRRYIQGHRKGKDANRIEREAMKDPFLSDALEGYDRLDKLDVRRISDIRRDIKIKTRKRHTFIRNFSVVASLLLCIAMGTYFLLKIEEIPEKEQIAQSEAVPDIQVLAEEKPASPPAASQAQKESLKQIVSDEISEDDIMEDDIMADEAEMAIISQELAAKPALSPKRLEMPEPVIGDEAYKKYLEENRIRPTDDACKDIQGEIIVLFYINESGRPYNIRVKESLCTSADQEAIRLVEKGPDWTTSEQEARITIKF